MSYLAELCADHKVERQIDRQLRRREGSSRVFAALLTTLFPAMDTAFAPGYLFLFFCFMMVLHLVWVRLFVPETKGRSLEEIQRDLKIAG